MNIGPKAIDVYFNARASTQTAFARRGGTTLTNLCDAGRSDAGLGGGR
jgi:hypothetical protein